MSVATLADILPQAQANGYAVPGFVVLGWEDARSFVTAAEDLGKAVILQAGPGCRAHTPLPILAQMFRYLAEQATVPVVCHLDHGYDIDVCIQAIDAGFSSVMYDGSKLPLPENIGQMSQLTAYAHKHGVSVEGEVGVVGYAEGAVSELTSPEEAAQFAAETGVDALAVSIGNVHLQQSALAEIDFGHLQKIQDLTSVPLVLHGGSGIDPDIRCQLAKNTNVSKFNIGTEIRQTFGASLRTALSDNPLLFDRLKILSIAEQATAVKAAEILDNLSA